MAAKKAGIEAPIEVDDNPATKRPCPSPSHASQEGTPLTLEIFQAAMQPLIAKIGAMETRIGQVETALTDRIAEQVNLLTAIANTQTKHSSDLANLQDKDKENQLTFQEIQQRLQKLETTPLGPRLTSTSTTDDRQPAMIMGGWTDDQDAEITLRLANEACKSLQLDLDMDSAFVPGLRRGYLVVPYKPRQQESERAMFQRLTQAIQQVRQAQQATGAMTPTEQPKYLWLSFSQTPERRRRARYAGKVKRLLLEQGASKNYLQIEFATGTAWYQGRKITSSTSPPPVGAQVERNPMGWLDTEAVGAQTMKSKGAISASWNTLLQPLLQ